MSLPILTRCSAAGQLEPQLGIEQCFLASTTRTQVMATVVRHRQTIEIFLSGSPTVAAYFTRVSSVKYLQRS